MLLNKARHRAAAVGIVLWRYRLVVWCRGGPVSASHTSWKVGVLVVAGGSSSLMATGRSGVWCAAIVYDGGSAARNTSRGTRAGVRRTLMAALASLLILLQEVGVIAGPGLSRAAGQGNGLLPSSARMSSPRSRRAAPPRCNSQV